MSVDLAARRTSASRIVTASPEQIFDVLTDPSKHPLIDGSGTVQSTGKTERLKMGSKFGMSMKFNFLPYRIGSTVVEFEEDRLIAWCHFGKHRWRYELEPQEDGTTRVTETFDWSTSLAPKVIEIAGYPKQHLGSIERTLDNLAELFADEKEQLVE